jgi:hypothetical protein
MNWRTCLPGLLIVATVGVPTAASANGNYLGLWQDRGGNAHHDGRGRVQATDLRYPLLDWTASNEGVAAAGSALLTDLDGDRVLEEIGLDGGTVVATDRALAVRWTSEPIAANRVFGVFSFGERTALIVGTDTGIALLDPATGGTAWQIDEVAGFDVVDLGGDNGDALLVRTAQSLGAYGVGDGLAVSELWSNGDIPDGDFNLTTGDVDNDGPAEIVGTDSDGGRIFVLNAATGDLLREREGRTVMGTGGCGPTYIGQVDGDEQAEVILTGARGSENDASVFVAVYDYVDDAMQWRYEYGHGDAELALEMLPDAVADLDGDGDWEIVLSIYNDDAEVEPDSNPEVVSDLDGISNPEAWTTVIYDAATGELVDHRTDTRAVAIVRVAGESRPVLVLRDAMRALDTDHPDLALSGYTLGRDGLEDLWRLQGARVVSALPTAAAGCAGPADELSGDLDGDGAQEIFIERHLDADGRPDLVQRVSLIYDTPVVDATLPLSAAHTVVGVHAGTGALDGNGHVALQLGDGHLTVFDPLLGAEQMFALGTYAASPRVMRLPENEDDDAGDQNVMVRDARGDLVLRDVGFAPEVRESWRLAVSDGQPLLAPLNNDSYSMFVYAGFDDGTPFLREVNHLGEEIWNRRFEGASELPRGFALGEFTGNAHDDLVYIVGDDPVVELLDGHSGEVRRSRLVSEIGPLGDNVRVLAVPGELGEFDDFVLVGDDGAYYIDSEDMSTRTELALGANAVRMISIDIDGNDVHEVFDNAGGDARSMVDPATDNIFWSVSNGDSDDHSYFGLTPNYPGVSDVDLDGDHDVALTGRFGDLTAHKGTDGTILWRVCLSGGNVTAIATDVPPTRGLCDGAALSDVSAGLLAGSEEAGEQFVVGSADGWLYTVNVADGSPLWTMPFNAAVGEVMLVSTDDTPDAELLVNVGNGSSFSFRDGLPPTAVRDVAVDGENLGDVDTDVDETDNRTALGFAWDAVEEAEGYEVAVIGNDGLIRTYEDVGDNTSVVVSELVLYPGHTYRAAVRAYHEERGIGHVSWSDGVTVPDANAPTVADVTATPDLFSPALGGSTEITASAADAEGLRGVRITASIGDEVVWTWTAGADRATQLAVAATWSGLIDDTPAADGEYTITVTALDFAAQTASATSTVTLDSTPPAPPTFERPTEGSILADSPVPLAGTAPGAATVEISLNFEVICTETVEGGTFDCETGALEDGNYEVTGVALDGLGNRSNPSAPVSFTVDTSAPEAPVIVSPVDGVTIEDTMPTFQGTGEAGSLVTVAHVDGDEICSATADETGSFSCVGTADFDPGQYTVQATAADNNGRTSDPSESVTFTVAKPSANNGANNGGNNGANNGGNNGANNGNNGNNGTNNGGNNGTDTDGVASTPDDGCGCQTPAKASRSPFAWFLRR